MHKVLRFVSCLLIFTAAWALYTAAPSLAQQQGMAPKPLVSLSPMNMTAGLKSRAEARAAINEEAVSFYTRRFGVSEETARDRLATQGMAPNLESMLIGSLGTDFVQLWFDNRAGDWVVAATSGAPNERVSAVMRSAGLVDHYRMVRVDFSRKAMSTGIEALAAGLSKELKPGTFTVGQGDAAINVMIADDTALTHAQQVIKTTLAGDDQPPVNFRRVESKELAAEGGVACGFPYCDTVVGGIRMWLGPGGSGGGCTAGFYVGSSGDPYPLVLTAGHCSLAAGNYQPWSTCGPFGGAYCDTVKGRQIPFYYYGAGAGDAGLFEDRNYPIYPGYINWSSGGLSTLHWYYGAGPAPNHSIVCHNGATNGSSCGEITDNNEWNITYGFPYGPTVLNGMLHIEGFCFVGGNSGSPVTMADSETAVGVASGGDWTTAPPCGTHSYAEPINRAVGVLGVTIYGG